MNLFYILLSGVSYVTLCCWTFFWIYMLWWCVCARGLLIYTHKHKPVGQVPSYFNFKARSTHTYHCLVKC
jgi:hypothetical protein